MKALAYAMRSFGREVRSGEVVVLLSAVILAVAAVYFVATGTDLLGSDTDKTEQTAPASAPGAGAAGAGNISLRLPQARAIRSRISFQGRDSGPQST